MINILTDVVEKTSTFDMDSLWIVIMIALPILLAIIASKTWNIFHGILTYLLFTFLVLFLLDYNILTKVFSDSVDAIKMAEMVFQAHQPVVYLQETLMNVDFLNEFLTGTWGNQIMLGGLVVVFLISQVIGSVLRSNR